MDFWTLALFRAFQTVGLAFLFVPNSTLSYSTLPRSLNADATALYSMFRNISGSIGIAVDHGDWAPNACRCIAPIWPTTCRRSTSRTRTLLSRHTQTLRGDGPDARPARTTRRWV